jgi:hypothetical protein
MHPSINNIFFNQKSVLRQNTRVIPELSAYAVQRNSALIQSSKRQCFMFSMRLSWVSGSLLALNHVPLHAKASWAHVR